MCGICFSVKQSFTWRGQHTQASGHSQQRRKMKSSRGSHSSGAKKQEVALSESSNDVPSSTLEARGLIGGFDITPCPVARDALMRIVNFPNCRRHFVAPSPQLLSSVKGSGLFMRVVENTRRRGPETFGATRRVLDEEWVLSTASTPFPPVTSAGESGVNMALPQQQHLYMKTELQGVSAVLGLRGHATVHQPFEMEVETDLEEEDERDNTPVNKSFLQWNGEIFNGPMCPPAWGSDTVVLASRLSQLEQECVPTSDADAMNHLSLRDRQELFLARCVQVFEEEVQGPYGFLFYANQLQLAVFGRDPLGRHSLLAHLSIYSGAEEATLPQGSPEGSSLSPLCSSRGTRPPAAEVELILASVGIQHAKHCTGENSLTSAEAGSGEGDRKRPRPSPTSESGSAPALPDAKPDSVALLDDPGVTGLLPQPPLAKDTLSFKEQRKAKKKLKTEAAAAATTTTTSPAAKASDALGDSENSATNAQTAAAIEEDESLQGCWAELPVSGLFAVPFDRPLIDDDVLLDILGGTEKSTGDATRPTCPTCSDCARGKGTARRGVSIQLNEEENFAVAAGKGIFMHCPWRDRYHLVHPLLRAFVAIDAQEKAEKRREDGEDNRSQKQALAEGRVGNVAADTATTAPLRVGFPTSWEPPTRPLLFSTEDTVPALPPLLAERISHFAPAAGASEDAVWAHWAATCYLHGLAAAVMRRTDVTAAGAEDSRDWATFAKAIRRPLCVLFSGGIDCTVLAALAHYLLPLETPIELVNVAFGAAPEQAPDRLAALRAVDELLKLPQPDPHEDSLKAAASQGTVAAREREWRLVLVDVPHKLTDQTSHILDLVTPRHTVMDLDIGTALWYAARGTGRMQVLRHSDVVPTGLSPADGSCSVKRASSPAATARDLSSASSANELSGLLHGFNKHVRVARPTAAAAADSSAERHTGGRPGPLPNTGANDHLHDDDGRSSGDDKFGILVEVLVAEARQGDGPEKPVLLSTLGKDYGPFLQPHIARHGYKKIGAFLNDASKAGLIQFDRASPAKAVLLVRPEDKARAAPPSPCRWFLTTAMQQQGRQSGGEMTPPPGTFELNYMSKAKVLLLGMGADETLGGYTRYRRFFGRQGMRGTQQELEKDFARLWMRNLGRDDRITMDSGREPRFPFLDEELLMTLEKIVAERRKALLSTDSLTSDSTFAQVLQRRAAAGTAGDTLTAAAAEGGVPTDDDVEAALLQTSLEPIMSFRLGPGEGDKRVLRNVAAMIGLDTVTRLQKRAIQFGTRIADRRVSGATEL